MSVCLYMILELMNDDNLFKRVRILRDTIKHPLLCKGESTLKWTVYLIFYLSTATWQLNRKRLLRLRGVRLAAGPETSYSGVCVEVLTLPYCPALTRRLLIQEDRFRYLVISKRSVEGE